jgi:uncharacterized protein YdbL (DUF1318 family)
MRLTLRTLLAWLDGVLPEGEQLEIGAKVSASAAATPLVERIRAAVGRAAVGTPRLDARGLADDPNSVAEYLDNTLSKDQLEGFERICIDSEMHLAEVAACHALLAELARDSARAQHIDAAGRQRLGERLRGMLAGLQDRAVTAAAAAQATEATDELRDTARALRAAIDGGPGAAVTMRPAAARPAPRRSSAAAWASAGLAIVLLLALATALAWTLGRGGRREAAPATAAPAGELEPQLAVAAVPAAPAVAEPAAPPADTAAVAPPASAPAATPELAPSGPVGAPGTPAEQPAAVTASPVVPLPEAGQATPPGPPMAATGGTGTKPEAAPTAAAAVSAATGAAAPPAAVAATVPPPAWSPPGAAPADPVGFVGGEGVLLRLATDVSGAEPRWTHFPAGSQLAVREQFLVPPLSQCDLHVRGVKIRLLPETRAGLAIDADGTPRLELVFGRAVVRASRADARLGITAAGLVGTIDAGLVEPVAAEVRLDRPLGDDPATVPPQVTARVGAGPRGIVWRQTMPDGRPAEPSLEGIAAQGLLDAGTALEWTSAAPDRIAVDRRAGQPPWVDSGLRLDRTDKSAGEALAAKVAATAPLDRALKELAADRRRVENRMIAAATLALLGDYDELVEQLGADAPGRKLEAGKWSALEAATVPLALSRGGNAASRLHGAFVNRGPHGKADLLWKLARGVTDEDLAAGVDRELVDALEDPDLIVRRYAIKVLCDVTRAGAADRNRYRADGLPDMRREGVDWWRKQLQRGLIRRTANGRLDQADAAEAATAPPERTSPPPEDDGNDERLLPAGRED